MQGAAQGGGGGQIFGKVALVAGGQVIVDQNSGEVGPTGQAGIEGGRGAATGNEAGAHLRAGIVAQHVVHSEAGERGEAKLRVANKTGSTLLKIEAVDGLQRVGAGDIGRRAGVSSGNGVGGGVYVVVGENEACEHTVSFIDAAVGPLVAVAQRIVGPHAQAGFGAQGLLDAQPAAAPVEVGAAHNALVAEIVARGEVAGAVAASAHAHVVVGTVGCSKNVPLQVVARHRALAQVGVGRDRAANGVESKRIFVVIQLLAQARYQKLRRHRDLRRTFPAALGENLHHAI